MSVMCSLKLTALAASRTLLKIGAVPGGMGQKRLQCPHRTYMLLPVLSTWVSPSRRQIAERTDRSQVTLNKCEPWPARSMPITAKTLPSPWLV